MSSSYRKMDHAGDPPPPPPPPGGFTLRLLASYALDWIVLVGAVVVGGFLGRVQPNRRPFALDDANIAFPFTTRETVPSWLLVVLCALAPAVLILAVCLVLVPGGTVPRSTPAALVWRRKLWELHVGWLGLLLAVGSAFFIISGIKNMCGKPRPDLLARCEPDLANAARFQVGGFAGDAAAARLYSADICQQGDSAKLNDGFRSYPSGHAAASASGLVYLTLFLASKFAVTLPFVVAAPASHAAAHAALRAFPSRARAPSADSAASASGAAYGFDAQRRARAYSSDKAAPPAARYHARVQAARRQAAAPPVYLLALTLVPVGLAVFISASRWFDFRHHGFDILFGFLIGTATAVFSFRYYHLPIAVGAGWAWGPRSHNRAFWAGVGRLGYVGDPSGSDAALDPSPDADARAHARADLGESAVPGPDAAFHHNLQRQQYGGPFQDVELDRLEQRSRLPVGQPADPSVGRRF